MTARVEGRGQADNWPLYLVGGLWLVALGLMLWAALAPAPNGWFYFAVGAFIGCSAAWTAVQLTQSNRSPFLLVVAIGVLFAVAAVLLFIEDQTGIVGAAGQHNGAVTVATWVCAYLSLGFLVEILREQATQHAWPFWAGLVPFAVGGAVSLGVALAFLLGAASGIVPLVALGVSALLLVPVGLNLISERALAVLQPGDGETPPRWRRRWVWAVAGLLLAGVPVVYLTVRSHWSWTALVVAACVLGLLAALVSNTHADIVAVLCVIALLGVAPAEVGVTVARSLGATQPTPSGELLALGDSYMSGEGARTFISATDEAGNDTCRRAPTAYAVLAIGLEDQFNHLSFLACSGARTNNVLPQPGQKSECTAVQITPCAQKGELTTQVDQVKALVARPQGYKPSLVILTIGGNDAGFADLGEACVAPGDCTSQQNMFLGNLRRVKSALARTYASIRAVLPGTPVVVVPYPQPLDDVTSCGSIALTVTERKFILTFLGSLDDVIEQAASQAHFYYLGSMVNALAASHLQLCDPANQGGYGINFVSPESVAGLPDQRFNPGNWLHDSFHPNEQGHQAMLAAFNTWLAQTPHADPDAPATADPAAATVVQNLPPEPGCYFGGDGTGHNSCDAMLRTWEYRQILGLWPYSIVVLIAAIGLWMLSVAGLSCCPSPKLPRPRSLWPQTQNQNPPPPPESTASG